MEELYQIYLITNIHTKKQYIGQVIQYRGYKNRFKEHLYGVKYANTRLLSNSIKKHGKEMFKIELIEDNIPESLIDEKEKYYIEVYKTLKPNGYNMTSGGQGVHGYKHTESDRKKISQASKNFWVELRKDKEKLTARNKKISKKLIGIKRSEETLKKQSEIATERFKHEPGTFTGKKHTDKTKQKIAEKNGYRVGMYDKNTGELLKTFISLLEATRWLIDNGKTENISASTRINTICNHIKGQGKTAYGYRWEYLEKSFTEVN